MAYTKQEKITKFLIFLYLVLFPFGQIVKIGIFHPTDLIAGLLFLILISGKFEKPHFYKYFKNFFWILLFSLGFSITIFPIEKLLIGLLYLIRLVSYSSMIFVVWALVNKKTENKNLLLNSLIAVAVASAVFGWIQYFFLGDLRSLKFFGWDDHLYRLAGTFLDPGFTGVILVLGSILAYSKKSWFWFLFLAVSVLFTYSRASYLAFAGGLLAFGLLKKDFAKSAFFLFSFLLFIFVLPRPSSEGVKLERLSSIYPRISNYEETINIVKKYPLFGIGFNNLCFLKGQDPAVSHSCSGSDASLLTLLATTGVVGLALFIFAFLKIVESGSIVLTSSLIAILINSLFINSLFYPFVMGFLTILIGISVKEKKSA